MCKVTGASGHYSGQLFKSNFLQNAIVSMASMGCQPPFRFIQWLVIVATSELPLTKMANRQPHLFTTAGISCQSLYTRGILEVKKYFDMQDNLRNSISLSVLKFFFQINSKLQLTMCSMKWTSCIAKYISKPSHVVDSSNIMTILVATRFLKYIHFCAD